MTTKVTLDKSGRVVLPKALRDELGLAAGDTLELESRGEQITLRPVRGGVSLRKERAIWVYRTGRRLTAANHGSDGAQDTQGAGSGKQEGRVNEFFGCLAFTRRAASTTPSCNRTEPALGHESKELEGSALRVLFSSFPLADEARRHIQVTGEDSLTGPLAQTERADFPGFQRPHRRKAQVIEFAHGALVHYAGRVKTFGGLMDPSR